jgi:hypothetical protein
MTSPTGLLYGVTEIETLVFAPVTPVEEIDAARTGAVDWETWGDARAALTPARYGELRDLAWLGDDPDDDEPLDISEVNSGEPWPVIRHAEMAGWLPEAILARHAEAFDTMLSSGVNVPADAEDAILAELAAAGIDCDPDDRVADLFDWS